jgi:hypothetical protein
MPAFDLRFVKGLCDDSGHVHSACQFHRLVDAATEQDAIRAAVAEFCRARRTRDWKIFADAIELRYLDDKYEQPMSRVVSF